MENKVDDDARTGGDKDSDCPIRAPSCVMVGVWHPSLDRPVFTHPMTKCSLS